MWLIILLSLLVFIIYKIQKCYKYWEEKGVPYVKPTPLLGNFGPMFFKTRATADVQKDMYNTYPNSRYTGVYILTKPFLIIRDLELIKQITIKDFDTFPDHKVLAVGEDHLLNKNLFAMTSKNGWHDMRATLSPAFTSSKMRTMFILMQQCSKQFVDYFKNQGDTVTIELKDTFSRFTNDVIGTTAFGITCDSLKDKDNEFYQMGKNVSDFSGVKLLKIFLNVVAPTLMKLLKVKLLSNETTTFFRSIIHETIQVREEKGVVRPDMIHLLMEARKNRLQYDDENSVIDSGFAVAEESEIGKTPKTPKRQKTQLTDDDIAAQALIFFLAGFDAVSTVMCYIGYELAVNPDIQEKLRHEVDKVIEECNGQVTYEALLGMKYLDNVVSEALRRHPPTLVADRNSVRPYTIQPKMPEEKPLHLETDSIVMIPIYSIHMDPKYYPNPEKFDPDRFNDENKHNINPFAFLPFGVGPRNCIGSRFALLENKLITVELLRHFEIVPVEKTEIPLRLSKTNPNPMPDGGIWVGLRKREQKLIDI